MTELGDEVLTGMLHQREAATSASRTGSTPSSTTPARSALPPLANDTASSSPVRRCCSPLPVGSDPRSWRHTTIGAVSRRHDLHHRILDHIDH
ncbi:MAG: hypothetical protein R2710_02950 [Acidimicrobiales bacterium]